MTAMTAAISPAAGAVQTVRGRACPLCGTPAGAPCQDKPAADHLARWLDSYTAGRLTRRYMAAVVGELVVIDTCIAIAIPAQPNGPDGFGCDCGARLPWPSKTEDVTCPECGTAWEHDGVDLGGGARIKLQPSCHYCGRTGQPLKPCCDRHPDDLVCADVAGCRDFLLAQLQEQDGAR